MSQQALSIKAGLAPNVVGDLERGNRTINAQDLVKICAALNVPVSAFLEEVKAAQMKTLHPVEEELRKRSRTRGMESGAPRGTELEVVFFRGVLRARAEGGLCTWIETLSNLLAQSSVPAGKDPEVLP